MEGLDVIQPVRKADDENPSEGTSAPFQQPQDPETEDVWKAKSAADKWIFFLAFVFPWACSTIISWLPFIRTRISQAPQEINLNAAASATELSSILLYFGMVWYWKTYKGGSKPPPTPPITATTSVVQINWMATAFSTWLSFIVFSPVLTGIYMAVFMFTFPCTEQDPTNPRCRLHEVLTHIIIAFRVFGVIGMAGISMKASDALTKRASQQRDGKDLA